MDSIFHTSSMYTTLAHPTPTSFPHHVQRSSADTDRDGRIGVKRSGAGESGRRERRQSGTYTGREREESKRVPRERLAIVKR